MKKSELYRKLQHTVLNTMSMPNEEKIQALRELMAQEDVAKVSEEQEAKQA